MSDEYGFTLVSFARVFHTGDNDDNEPTLRHQKLK